MLVRYNEETYFQYLCGLVNWKPCKKVLRHLHSVPFAAYIGLDSNRAWDGKELRRNFRNAIRDYELSDSELMAEHCSMLEMLIPLAKRMTGFTENSVPDDFMWLMRNMHLDDMTDNTYDESFVQKRIDIINNRTYGAFGENSLFPLDRTPEGYAKKWDSAERELWAQLNEWAWQQHGVLW